MIWAVKRNVDSFLADKEPLCKRMDFSSRMLLYCACSDPLSERRSSSNLMAALQYLRHDVSCVLKLHKELSAVRTEAFPCRFANIVGAVNLQQSQLFRARFRRICSGLRRRRLATVHVVDVAPYEATPRNVFGVQLIHNNGKETDLYFEQLKQQWSSGAARRGTR